MKSGLLFWEQIESLNLWFEEWSRCEQTVALYTMFRKLKPYQVKFLLQALQQTSAESTDIHVIEAQANNPGFISDLCRQSKDAAMQQLLECVPLLKTGCQAAKAEYLNIIPKIFEHSVENSCHLEDCRHLLAYCLIHPALTPEERSRFNHWLPLLEEGTPNTNNQSHSNSKHEVKGQQNDSHCLSVELNNPDNGFWGGLESSGFHTVHSSGSSITPVGRAITSRPPSSMGEPQGDLNAHRKISGSAPITPPTSNVYDWLNRHHDEMSHEHHAPLSPQSSSSSSGASDCQEDTSSSLNHWNTFLEAGSGMREVPIWLKSLRLHKYSYIFQQLTYEEMLTLKEDWLQSRNVTKGARHKIVISINKLKERQSQLRQLERDIVDPCNLRQALVEVKGMMNTPIKMMENSNSENEEPSIIGQLDCDTVAEGDITGQITRLLWKTFKVCTQMLVTARPEDESLSMYLQILDKCLNHEAWTTEQKKKIAAWKQHIQKAWQPHAQKYLEKQRKMAYNNVLAQSNMHRIQRALRCQSMNQVLTAQKWPFGALPPTVVSSHLGVPQVSVPLYRNNSFNAALTSRSPLYELQSKQPVSKTNSVPLMKSNMYNVLPNRSGVDLNMMEPELAARLESLCLSMTEHAIGNFDSPEKGSTM